jgi:hypothetical protein
LRFCSDKAGVGHDGCIRAWYSTLIVSGSQLDSMDLTHRPPTTYQRQLRRDIAVTYIPNTGTESLIHNDTFNSPFFLPDQFLEFLKSRMGEDRIKPKIRDRFLLEYRFWEKPYTSQASSFTSALKSYEGERRTIHKCQGSWFGGNSSWL